MLSSPSPLTSSSSSSSNFPSSSSASTAVRAKMRSYSSSNSTKSVTRDNACSKHVYSSGSDATRESSANLTVLAAQRTVLEGDSRYGITIRSFIPFCICSPSFLQNKVFFLSLLSPLSSAPPSFFLLHFSLSYSLFFLLPSLFSLFSAVYYSLPSYSFSSFNSLDLSPHMHLPSILGVTLAYFHLALDAIPTSNSSLTSSTASL